jgi:DNA-binding response OmpR family regulator
VLPVVFVIAKPYDAEVIRKAAVEAGYQAEVSDGSDRPFEGIQRLRPAVVVLSLRLSRANATQILMQLRADPVCRHIPIILVSEADSSLTLKEALQLGADHLMLRPLDPVLLMAKIDSLVDATGPQAALPAAEQEEVSPEVVEQFRQRLEHRRELVRESDYFSLLDVGPEATAEEVQHAHRRITQELDGAQLPTGAAEELADQLAETSEVLDEAYRVLSDDRLREAYRKAL